MNNIHEVCILGHGVVGQALAIALARANRRVALVGPPSVHPQASDVRAYALNQASKTLLESLDAWPTGEAVTAVEHMQVWGDDGGNIVFPGDAQSPLTWIVDVPALTQRLTQQAQSTRGLDWLASPAAAPLTIVCEGRYSQTRAQLGAERQRLPYGQAALATRMRTEYSHCAQASQWFSAQGIGGPNILALLPLGGRHGLEVAVVWSLPTQAAQSLQAMPDADFESAIHSASQGLLGHLRLSAPRSTWPLEWGQADHWCGREANGKAWVLAGDAARNIHPLAGLGLNLGLGDVRVLLDQLPTLQGPEAWRPLNDLRVLRRYERQRKAESAPTTLAVDAIQRLFMHPDPQVQRWRNWGLSAVNQWSGLKHWIMQRAWSPL